MIREPVVAGRFYPGSPERLGAFLDDVMEPKATARAKAIGVVSPHAGYVYSGAVAGRVFSAVDIPPSVLLLGPNHTGHGARAAILSRGSWRTPLGVCEVDEALADALKAASPLLKEDATAHLQEHSLEVQVPFLQRLRPDVKIVPVVFMLRNILDILEVGRAIGFVLRDWPSGVLMVASSDMTHYEPDRSAREKDALAAERILALDPEGLVAAIARHRISMCGVVPTAVMLAAARELGAKSARQVAYATSGEVTGDYASVVGYAGIVVS